MTQQLKTTATIKNELLNTALVSFTIISFPSLIASLSRMIVVGWKPVMSVQIAAFVFIVATALNRKRLSFAIRATILLGLLYVAGCAGLITWGLIGMGTFWLVTLCVLTTVFLGGKAGFWALMVSTATMVTIGILISYDFLSLGFNNNEYAVAKVSWLTAIMGIVFFTLIMGMCISKMHLQLLNTIAILNNRTKELKDTNRELLKEINERKAAEKDKIALKTKLLQARKMEVIGTLAGGIAHDFNNILSGIFGYSQLAQMHIENPIKANTHIQQIVKGAQRATELTRQILTFSRQSEYQKQPIKINLEITEALKLLRSSIPTTIEIKSKLDSEKMMMADPIKIHQVIMNLCTNSYHAMRKTGGCLTVSLTSVEFSDPTFFNDKRTVPGEYIKLEVSDTGHGMDKKTLKHLEPTQPCMI